MHVQEKRILFVHPSLAYGVLTTLPPCCALVVKVELLDVDLQTSRTLIPLESTDLSWVQDSSFYNHIEHSLMQQPCFTGFFYHEMFNEMKH
jgi:hypothetical protein